MKPLIILSGLLVLLLIPPAYATDDAHVSTNATAKVLIPLAITKTHDLEFGSFTASDQEGTITSDSSDGTNGITRIEEGSDATYEVTGEPDMAYTIIFPVAITLENREGDSMDAALSIDSDDDGSVASALNSEGDDDFIVHGVLTVGANQTSGDYSTTYDVTVSY